jgi:predicted nucleotidyltransferase component of viral defense system
MKDIALQTAAKAGGRPLNILREYLQNEILVILQRAGFIDSLQFVGGTALRFLYGIGRFSEDIDFCAEPTWRRRGLKDMADCLSVELRKAGYAVEPTVKEEKIIQRAFIRFAGILQEAGLVRRESQKLSINIEIDVNPPEGWVEERTIVNLHMPVLLRHFDKASLFATKIAAFLSRSYTKGRDVYDLIWLRSKWNDLGPNLVLLNNALTQKRTGFVNLDEQTWPSAVSTKAEKLDWKEVVRDVQPFLADPREISLLTRDNFLLLYERIPGSESELAGRRRR